MKKAVYAGSFDPFTNGHLYIYNQAVQLFGFNNVVILLANNIEKKRYTKINIMQDMLKSNLGLNVDICYGLVADYCKENNIDYIIRGLRNTSDYMYEEEIAKINYEINSDLKTIYFRADDDVISSTMVRLLHEQGKNINKYVPSGIII